MLRYQCFLEADVQNCFIRPNTISIFFFHLNMYRFVCNLLQILTWSGLSSTSNCIVVIASITKKSPIARRLWITYNTQIHKSSPKACLIPRLISCLFILSRCAMYVCVGSQGELGYRYSCRASLVIWFLQTCFQWQASHWYGLCKGTSVM